MSPAGPGPADDARLRAGEKLEERPSRPAPALARHAGFTAPQWSVLLAFAALVGVSWWHSPWPVEQALHHSLTMVAIVALAFAQRRYVLPLSSFLLVLAFLALHTVAARWLYSYVPYDAWTRALLGFRLSDALGWQRNHFDRLVHLSYGLCLAPVAFRYFVTARRWSQGWAALVGVEIVLSTSAVYELFEWGIGVVLAPAMADAYNGQQGDPWDAHRDIALATLGAVLAAVVVLWRAAARASHASRQRR